MRLLRPSLTAAVAAAALILPASPASAIVGGTDVPAGKYPAVAQITFGASFSCTGTLIAPDAVLTAGHCSSPTGAVAAIPVGWPAQLIDVRIGNSRSGTGGEVVPVKSVAMHRNYLATKGYDVSVLKLSRNASATPVKVAGASETGLWAPGTPETIVGWGVTSEGGDAPDVLQEAQVPVVSDAVCDENYDGSIDPTTMLCAGYPEGGVDTCQGDSGGPMFGRTASGALRVVGATSFGEGCARAGKPGVYARVGDTELREWIRGHAPGGVAS